MNREQGTHDLQHLPGGEFASRCSDLDALCPLAPRPVRDDISHRVSTALRNLIACFG
jgi:hypothetical protein